MTDRHRYILRPGGEYLDCVDCPRSLCVNPKPPEPKQHVTAGSGLKFNGGNPKYRKLPAGKRKGAKDHKPSRRVAGMIV